MMALRRYTRLLNVSLKRMCSSTSEQTETEKPTDEVCGRTLAKQLNARIKATGPITVADYIREVLTNPIGGYYMNKDVFGKEGDFITSPEIGQMFGELVGIWFLNEWNKIGSPTPFQFIELGPGRGSLCNDVLKVFKHFEATKDMGIRLVEISPHLSGVQEKCLGVTIDKQSQENAKHYKCGVTSTNVPVYWYSRIEDIPQVFSLVCAHEFFDALPIHKLQKTKDGWREVLVDVNLDTKAFHYVLARSHTAVTQMFVGPNEMRDQFEVCPDALVTMAHLATRLERDGGFALIGDYGHMGDKTDTFRAFKNHKLHDPLVNPGSADVTADVDFKRLRLEATKDNKLISFGPIAQREFLQRMGIDVRLDALLKQSSEEQKKILKSGYNLMMDTDKMGERFKLMSLFPTVLKDHLTAFPVAGFH